MRTLVFFCSVLFSLGTFADTSPDDLWSDVSESSISAVGERQIEPTSYRVLQVDHNLLQLSLASAPVEGAPTGLVMSLPLPHGGFQDFSVVYSSVMAPELAARYPEITTYSAQGLDDPTATARLDLTPHGFHAMVFSSHGTYFIDPYQTKDTSHYLSYFKTDARRPGGVDFQCDFSDAGSEFDPELGRADTLVPIEGELLVYRAAVACTGEYAGVFGGTVPNALAAIVTAMNRVNQVYERDLAIRMVLVANNDQVIFTNGATDPYSNNSGGAMLGQNQTTLDDIIGDANYDIGHVFSTGGGGVATLGVPCRSGVKARGVTGLPNPQGDPFYIDFVAHEMGHQWGGTHTFNGTQGNCAGGNRTAATAFEPGSGSTIQAYAGICGGDDLQNNSDDHFHGGSYDQMVAYSRSGSGANCPVVTVVANSAPEVDAGNDFTIPQMSAFELTGSATDADGDTMTYNWEQMDAGDASSPFVDTGNNALFRSFPSEADPTRIFPKLSDILNQTSTIGELLPSTNRFMTMRMTVRDNRAGGGGVDFDETTINVTTNSGPFLITAPNTAVTWQSTTMETVTWDVAGTTAAPVSCANVDILLSTDGGQTFPITVLANTPNDGTQMIQVPTAETTTARLKVKCSDNVFLDISNADFTIETVLVCISNFAPWNEASDGQFLDFNNNGVVDVIDVIECLIAP